MNLPDSSDPRARNAILSSKNRSEAVFPGVFLAALLGYSCFLAAFSNGGFPTSMSAGSRMPFLADKPLGEDGFYMMTVAWRWGEGKGFSYNGPYPTSGVQPLYTAVLGGLAALVQAVGGDRWVFARATLALGAVNLLVFSLLAGWVAVALEPDPGIRASAWVWTSMMAAANFWVFRSFTYGLETGLYLILLALLAGWTLRLSLHGAIKDRHAVPLGILCGLAGLTRLDFGIVLAVVLAVFLWKRVMSLRSVLTVGSTAGLMVAPWLLYVRSVTGGFFPSSGLAQSKSLSTADFWLRVNAAWTALAEHLSPWVYTGGRRPLTVAASLSMAAFLLWAGPRFRSGSLGQRRVWKAWLAAFSVLCLVYFACFWAAHFYDRYTSPILIVVLPWLGIGAARRLSDVRPIVRQALYGALVASFCAAAWISLHTGRIGNTHSVTAGFVASRIPPNLTVGAFQSGVVGFFNPNVVNLDGKIDSRALLYASQGRLSDYIDERGIDVLVDWKELLESALPAEYVARVWRSCEGRIENGVSVCLERRGREDPLKSRGRPAGKERSLAFH